MEVSTTYILFCAAALMVAFGVRGGTGFGGATLAVPALAFALPTAMAVSIVAVLSTVNSIDIVRRDWRNIDWSELRRLLPYTLAGIATGLYFMSSLDDRALRQALGIFLIIYSGYTLLRGGAMTVVSDRWCRPLAATTGTIGGFLGALFGAAAGSIYAIYLNVRQLDKRVFRVTITSIMLIGLLVRVGGYAELGFYGLLPLLVIAAGLPMMFLGSWLGDRLTDKLNTKNFGRVIGAVVLCSGVGLLAS